MRDLNILGTRMEASVLFLESGYDSYDRKQLKEPTKPLYGFSGKRIEPVGVITLPVSFGTPKHSYKIHHL
jgi:hypothetical protein